MRGNLESQWLSVAQKSPRDLEKGGSPRSKKAEQNYNFKQIMALKCVPGL